MKRIVLFLVVLLIFGWSCSKKKYPESFSENAPVFYFKANINNAAVEYNAGVNNYRVFSSYNQDSNNVYNLIAELKQKDCQNNCANSIKIQINDYKISSVGASMIPDSALKIGNYKYVKDIVGTSYTVAFNSLSNKSAQSYKWDFGDGSTSNEANPSHVYKSSGKYQVCLVVNGQGGFISSICNSINVQSNNPLNSYIKTGSIEGDSVVFEANTSGGKTPHTYSWDFGDGAFSNSAFPIHNYAISGSYPVSLKVTDNNGESVKVFYNVVTKKDASSFAANYSSNISNVQKNAVAPSKIIIQYTDENGLLYSSLNSNQPGNSNFEILDVSNFDANENNQSTKKLKIKFNCVVYNGSRAISINNAETVIAVAYK